MPDLHTLLRNPPPIGSKEALISFLDSLPRPGERADYEVVHVLADGALLAFMDDKDITRAWNEVGKWYA